VEGKRNKSKPSQLAGVHAAFQTAGSENVHVTPLAEQLCPCLAPLEAFWPPLLIRRQNVAQSHPWGRSLSQPACAARTVKGKIWLVSLYNSTTCCTLKNAAHLEIL